MTSFQPLPHATIPAEDEALRGEVKAFLAETLAGMPPEKRARSWMGADPSFSRALGRRGWLGLSLPKRYGGAERGFFARFVIAEELLAAGAPVAAHWITDRQSGPLILRYGTEAQRTFYLPKISAGEIFFCIGMSEPNSGSDLASVRTRAEPLAGGGYRLNGRKIWTSNAAICHYMIALVRTSGTPEDRQKGLSQVIIDLKQPGITIRPIRDLSGDAHFAEVTFDDVILPSDALIGEEGAGWEQVNAELAFERSGPERILSSMVLVDTWLAWLKSLPSPSSDDLVLVGRLAAQLAALRALSIGVTARLVAGDSPVVHAALVKDLGTTYEQMIPRAISAAIAGDPGENPPEALMRTLAYTVSMAPSFSLRGGTREILRGMIARGIGLR
ncbi:MAG: acyl-CoA dehydrogenase family protein [Phreatobacter sp.]|uniref:acyl-CoA dehydrogenase family protein n=1 Tax=Phreatobacter sp. TaxID=1966341 RepID=UPI0040351763